jgi:hypothetical protein
MNKIIRLRVVLALFILVGPTAGCISTQTSVGPRPAEGVGIQPTEPLNTTAPFNLTGHVYFYSYVSQSERTQFKDVQLCLYNRNGTVIESASLGTFETNSTVVNISVQTDLMPWYIYVHHPEFPVDLDNELRIYNADEDRFDPGTPEDLPFNIDRLTDTRCTPA